MAKTIHRQLFGAAMLALMVLSVNACCYKVDCVGVEDLSEIWFYNFANADLETLVVKRYEQNTGFATILDSTVITGYSTSSQATPERVSLPGDWAFDHDYKIELPNTGQTFTLSDFVVKKLDCNTGFLCNNKFNSLSSYEVNGELKNGRVEIHN